MNYLFHTSLKLQRATNDALLCKEKFLFAVIFGIFKREKVFYRNFSAETDNVAFVSVTVRKIVIFSLVFR